MVVSWSNCSMCVRRVDEMLLGLADIDPQVVMAVSIAAARAGPRHKGWSLYRFLAERCGGFGASGARALHRVSHSGRAAGDESSAGAAVPGEGVLGGPRRLPRSCRWQA